MLGTPELSTHSEHIARHCLRCTNTRPPWCPAEFTGFGSLFFLQLRLPSAQKSSLPTVFLHSLEIKVLHVLILILPPWTSSATAKCGSLFVWFFVCLVLNFWLHPMACGTLVPRPGLEPTPPALEGGVLTTGPPGKSLLITVEVAGGDGSQGFS